MSEGERDPGQAQAEQQDLQQIRNVIAFGMDVEQFGKSPIGVYLIERANRDAEAATNELKTVDPENPKAIRDLQNKARTAELFLSWLGEAVSAGENAQAAFHESGN